MAVNHVVEIGNLTRDAEMKYLSSGTAVLKFSIAVNERRKQGEQWVDEANFFDVVLYGKSAENLNQYLVKGKQVAVEGKLHQNRWEHEGKTMTKIEIVASNVQLLGGKSESRDEAPPRSPSSVPPRVAAAHASDPPDFEDDWPPEIPF